MTRLSVNINKFATLRNARGGNMPDVEKAALDCVKFGAEGITVHPRPDERHIRYSDVRAIRPLLDVEMNIEGNPIPKFIDIVNEVVPNQVTLVPDAPDAITSNAGWDTLRSRSFLTEVCSEFHRKGIRTRGRRNGTSSTARSGKTLPASEQKLPEGQPLPPMLFQEQNRHRPAIQGVRSGRLFAALRNSFPQ